MTREIETLIEAGFDARRADRPEEALVAFTAAIEAAETANERVFLIRALKGYGQIERDSGDREGALSRYRRATELCREEDDALLLAHTIRHVADILLEMGELDLAEAAYREALDIYSREPADGRDALLNVANAVRPYAELREAQGRSAEALSSWREARDLYSEVGIPAGVTEAEAHIASLEKSPG